MKRITISILIGLAALLCGSALAVAASHHHRHTLVNSNYSRKHHPPPTTSTTTPTPPPTTSTTTTTPPPTTSTTTTTPPPTTTTVPTPPPTTTTTPTPPPSNSVVLSGGGQQAAGVPRSDSACASAVQPVAENRPQNTTANNTVPPNTGANIAWGTGDDSFKLWPQERASVTGQYTGTTDEILQWATCKWGFPADLARAEAVSESNWVQADVGDKCGGDGTNGVGSYGLLQLKNLNCSGVVIDGGWPDTQNDTALSVDFWGAHIRACYDGAFSGWLYDGVSVSQDIANHESYSDPSPLTGDPGQDYVLWGCIGQWYSGGWWNADAVNYINGVQSHLAAKPWLQPGF